MKDYDYEYSARISDPAYYVDVGCERDTMRDAQEMMDNLGIRGIAVVGNLYFYKLQDLRHFMFYWKAHVTV